MLPALVYSYNHTVHHSIKTELINVTARNEKRVWHTLYDDQRVNSHPKYKFNVGDQVRISKIKNTFEMDFSKEIFTVTDQIPRNPPMYKIKDYDGEELKGTFYGKELQKVTKQDDEEKNLKKRGKGKTREYFVKWLGYPNKFN